MNRTCEEYRSWIADQLSGVLSSQESRELRRHLDACSACRRYLEMLRADNERLVGFTNALRPAVERIQEAVIGSLDSSSPGQARRAAPAEIAIGPRRFWLAVAAAIALVSLGVLGYVLTPLMVSTPTLAQTLAAMQARPWVHSVTKIGATVYEDWQRFGVHVRARKGPGGNIEYLNFPENVAYRYNPNSHRITVSFVTDSSMVPGPKTAFEMLSEVVELARRTGETVTRRPAVENGRRVELICLTFPDDPYPRSVVVVRDIEQNLLVRMEQEDREGHEAHVTVTFDYPDPGPADIYALGVPRDAPVLDLRPEGPALALVQRIQERFERGLPDHVAVILESHVDEKGTLSPLAISILWQKGGRKRVDRYYALDFARAAGRPGTLYPRIKEDWPNLTIPQVLALETDEALEWRMLFDGQRTIRYRRHQGELVKDEMPMIDEFLVPAGGPYINSLTSLIWPNLYLTLQGGSSHFKREVRLLSNDPNRPNLVGLQFVRFAEREDYWFDPAEGDLMMERTHRWEGIGVIARDVVVQSERAPWGQWYPKVMRMEHRNSTDGMAVAQTRRYESRVLVDPHPKIDETVFTPTPDVPPGRTATDPNSKASSSP